MFMFVLLHESSIFTVLSHTSVSSFHVLHVLAGSRLPVQVPNLTGAYARVGDTLSRTVSVVLQRVNLGVTVGARYQGCTKIDKVEMKIAEIAVQYRFRCVAKLDGYVRRESNASYIKDPTDVYHCLRLFCLRNVFLCS